MSSHSRFSILMLLGILGLAVARPAAAAQSLYFYDHAKGTLTGNGQLWNNRGFSFDPSTGAQQVGRDWSTPGIPWNHAHPITYGDAQTNWLYTLDANGRMVVLDITSEASGGALPGGRIFFENRTSVPLKSTSVLNAYLVPGEAGKHGQAFQGCLTQGGGYLWVASASEGAGSGRVVRLVRLDLTGATNSIPVAEQVTTFALPTAVDLRLCGLAYANGSLWLLEMFGNMAVNGERLWRFDVGSGTPTFTDGGPRYVDLGNYDVPEVGMTYLNNRLWVIDTACDVYDFDPATLAVNGSIKPATKRSLPWVSSVVPLPRPMPFGLAAGPTNLGPLDYLTISAPDASGSEQGTNPLSIQLTRGAAVGDLNVYLAITPTATADLTPSWSGQFATIPNGSASVVLPIAVIDDTLDEGTEQFQVSIVTNAAYITGMPSTVTLSVADNDRKPVVTLVASDAAAGETAGNPGAFTLSLNLAVATQTVITMNAPGGTATNGSDYATLPASVTIAAGATSIVVPLTPIDDPAFEGPETVTWSLAAGTGYTVGSPASASASVTLTDNDLPTVTIASSDATATEGGSDNASVTITRSGNQASALTVRYASTGGTATAGSDYPALATSVVIAAGQDSATVILGPLDDAAAELPETVIIGVTADPAYVIGSPATVTLTIHDNEAPLVSIAASDANAKEGGADNGKFTLTRLGLRSTALTVNLDRTGTATPGSDHTALPATVVIAANVSTVDVPVTVLDDAVAEPDETVIATVKAGTGYAPGATIIATVTIADNETPVVSIAASDATAAEAGLSTGAFTLTRLGNKSLALTVNIGLAGSTAVNGTDFDAITATVPVAANATTAVVTVKPKDDTALEPSETVICTLASGTGYVVGTPANATVTITDNDTQTVSITASAANAAEPATNGAFVVKRSGPTGAALVVTYAIATGTGKATNGTDYATIPTTVTIAAGNTDSAAIPITVIDDAGYEGPEQVTLTISANAAYVVGSPASATVTMADNDKPTVTVAVIDASAAEPSDTGKYRITRSGITTLGSLTVSYGMGGLAGNGNDYTLLNGTAVIAQNSASVDVTLTPIPDTLIEGAEIAVMTLSSNASYNLGTPVAATVTIGASIIDTIAGKGPTFIERPTEGAQATATGLILPTGIAVDGAGNRYIADSDFNSGGHAIWKVDASGVITRFAGNAGGTAAFAGDGGAATAASLSEPRNVALDAAGNVYIADTGNHRIRKVVVATGIITTVAGGGSGRPTIGDDGQATMAALKSPSALAIDGSGNLFIADTGNNRIRKVTVASGVITTVAGTGIGFGGDGGVATAAQLSQPMGIDLDAAGNVYIADTNNHRIRKLTVSTGIITTIAGDGTSGPFAGDGGSPTAAHLNTPGGVAISDAGEVFIADTLNNRVRKIEGGIIITVVGNGAEAFTGDNGPAPAAGLWQPTALAFDAIGNLLIADSWNSAIRRLKAGVTAVGWRIGAATGPLMAALVAPQPTR